MGITRIGTTARWSDVVIFNNVLYTVEVPTNLDAGLKDQTKEVLNSIAKILSDNGSDKKHILSVTIYLKDIAQIDEFNQIWDKWLPLGSAPVRACVEARLANQAYLVEIQLSAAVINTDATVKFMT
ncbi:MAG TPA: RidA family protein [Burkholderiales bacterium]|nr:RidA family protein [Burkholderiales bacterium]